MITRRTHLAGLAAVMVAPGAAHAQAIPDPELPLALDTLSALSLAMPQSTVTTLGAHLRPGPAVIAFWATWCSPCLAEGRMLARIRTRTPPERLNIIGVNMDREETRASGQLPRFMQRARMNYTQLWGTIPFYRAFNNPGEGARILLPRLYIFAANGNPVAAFGRYDGASSLREIERTVAAVLA